jgi:hypothetical protein
MGMGPGNALYSADEIDGQQTSDLEHDMRIGRDMDRTSVLAPWTTIFGRPSGRPERRLHVRASKTGGTL